MLNDIAFVIVLIVVALAVRSLPNLPDLPADPPVMPTARPQPRRRTGPRAPRRRVQR